MQHFHARIVDEVDLLRLDHHPCAVHPLQTHLQVMAGAEEDRAADPQNVLITLVYMLNPRLRGPLEVEEQRRQHAGIDCCLQFQEQGCDAGQRHHHEFGTADPQQGANAAMVDQAPGDQQNAASHGRDRDVRDQAGAEDREQRHPQRRKNARQRRTSARVIAQA